MIADEASEDYKAVSALWGGSFPAHLRIVVGR
jgi:hypothetical protein